MSPKLILTLPLLLSLWAASARADSEVVVLSWNAFDLVESAETDQGTLSLRYDGDGRRALKSVGSSSILYIRDGSGRILAEYDQNGNLIAEYVYGAGRRLARLDAGGRSYYHPDPAGTPLWITGATGGESWSGTSLPFGEPGTSTGAPPRYRFAGQELDDETNLYAFEARPYEPAAGIFLSFDPGRDVRHEDPQSWNLYAYARNNPIALKDPDGRRSEPAQPAAPSRGAESSSGAGPGGPAAGGEQVVEFAGPEVYLGNVLSALDGVASLSSAIWNHTVGGLLGLPARQPAPREGYLDGGAYRDLAHGLGQVSGGALAAAGAVEASMFGVGFAQGLGPAAVGDLAFTSSASAAGYSTLSVPGALYGGGAQAGFLYGSSAYSFLTGTPILVGPAGAITYSAEIPFYQVLRVPLLIP